MTDASIDPLLLGQRVIAILETGLRTATYKLATLMALIDHCIENLAAQPDDPPVVGIPEIPDVAGHLFGRERTALAAVREPFKDAFGAHCFSCGTHLPAANPIDHVPPGVPTWSGYKTHTRLDISFPPWWIRVGG